MVQNSSLGAPQSWGDVRMIVLGDSHIGGLSFKEIPAGERPRLRARSYKNARLLTLLPMVEKEITEYKPHLLVVSVGHRDLTQFSCQHFSDLDHQHHVHMVSLDFSVKLAADEIFMKWHSWLAKYNCKVLFALTYPVDFKEYNYRKLKHCPECQEKYVDDGQRELMVKRIKEWGELLSEKNVPVMYLDDVLKRINPNYMTNDSQQRDEDRALLDGVRINKAFPKHFYAVIREVVEKVWPNFIGGEADENVDDTDLDLSQGSPQASHQAAGQASPEDSPPAPPPPKEENNEDASAMPPKKKSKHAFRF